jgi:hypothetical protein
VSAHPAGRRLVGSFPLPAREQLGVFFVEPDELDQVFDAKVGGRLNTILAEAIDPDQAVLNLHFDGNVAQSVLVFTEVFCDLGDGGDVMNLVDVRGHAARAENADAGIQFQGRSSSSR